MLRATHLALISVFRTLAVTFNSDFKHIDYERNARYINYGKMCDFFRKGSVPLRSTVLHLYAMAFLLDTVCAC